jgi:inward rectifier potassium channel
VAEAPRKPRRDPTSAIRLGLTQRPLTDLYYHLMRAPWWQLIGLMIGGYVLANLGFAALYMMDLEGIATAEEGFTDAFAFSVQTISTIGYGSLTPRTPFVHALVTAEAMVGLLGFAIATGLMFNKFAVPRARVMFSQPLVLTEVHGQPTLMFRVGNARGNEIIEASIRVTVLKSEVSPEGHRMRRLHDLKLQRQTTPVFAMTWTVMHTIDADSPLSGETVASMEEDETMFIISMTGLDGTFSQTVHARMLYEWHDIRHGHRFVDIISFDADNRATIDYGKFHDTEAMV